MGAVQLGDRHRRKPIKQEVSMRMKPGTRAPGQTGITARVRVVSQSDVALSNGQAETADSGYRDLGKTLAECVQGGNAPKEILVVHATRGYYTFVNLNTATCVTVSDQQIEALQSGEYLGWDRPALVSHIREVLPNDYRTVSVNS